jgi:hypothetical protein
MFHEFGAQDKADITELFTGMAEYAKARPQEKSAE